MKIDPGGSAKAVRSGKVLRGVEDDPLPGDFPIGSVESRAAARAMLASGASGPPRFEIVHHVARPRRDARPGHAGPWQPCTDGRLMRLVYVARKA